MHQMLFFHIEMLKSVFKLWKIHVLVHLEYQGFLFLFIFEIIANYQSYFFIYVVFIPFFSRMLTGIGLILIQPAKKSGLGYLFKSDNDQHLKLYLVYIIPIIIILGIYNLTYMIVFVIILSLIGILHILYKS